MYQFWLSWNSLYRPGCPQTHRDSPISASQSSFGRLLKAVHLSSDRSNLNLDIIEVRMRLLLSPECLFTQQHLFEVSGCESQERGFFIAMLYNELKLTHAPCIFQYSQSKWRDKNLDLKKK